MTDPRTLWKFPFKPVRMPETALRSIDQTKYTMEKKFDGWRAIVVMTNSPTLWTREKVQIDLPDNLKLQLADLSLPEGTVLDGEIWNPLKRGGWRHNSHVICKLTLWDVVRFGKQDVSNLTIEDRRNKLKELLSKGVEDVQQVEPIEATKEEFDKVLEEAKAFRTENALRSGYVHGVVLKRRGSPRRDNAVRCVEHPDWLKVVFSGMKGWEPRA